ncbi:MAG: hypothetical protein JXR03_02655 [Cyclobacteriaceae bacterium]
MRFLKLASSVITVASMLLMLASCEPEALPCQDLQFTVDVDDETRQYTISADFEGIEELVYGWYVNDQLVETEDLNGDRDNIFNFELAPGTYNVCIKAESAECDELIEFCLEVVVEGTSKSDDCPELAFGSEQISENKYLFEADFDGMDSVAFVWYVNGDSIESEPLGADRFHKFDWEFEEGVHSVCIKAENDRCEKLEFCKEIVIGQRKCPELHFSAEKENESTYFFFADFEGKENTSYKWLIDDEYVDKENHEGTETDHKLVWQFDAGEHVVCIIVETDECEEVEYCEEVVIEGKCPELEFTAEPDGDFAYLFTATFEGREDIKYKWWIDDDLVDYENYEDKETDHKLYYQFNPGTYQVCMVAYESDLCEEVEYCKEITIEGDKTCENLYFKETRTDDGNWKFIADFEGIEKLEWYGWYIDGELIENEGTLHDGDNYLYHDFTEEGVYEVCLFTETEDCPEGAEYCESVEVKFGSNDCADILFDAERDGENLAYFFTANFEGRDDVDYKWTVYAGDDYQGGEERAADSNDDHKLYWQFETGVEYTVCLKQEGGCEGRKVCEEFIIN